MALGRYNKALVVLSGGQDSTICLFDAMQNYEEVHAVTFDYDQRHRVELLAATTIAKMAKVHSHEIVTLGPILKGCSPLTDPSQALETYSDFASMDKTIGNRVELTFVPMRNALFLTLAANRAAVMDIGTIVTGVCQADNANYPDCRRDYIDAQEVAINKALGNEPMRGPLNVPDTNIYINTPLMDCSKAASIRAGMRYPGCYAALGFSHTAYDGTYPPTGSDHASVLREHGFQEAGIADPLLVRACFEGLMSWPEDKRYAVPREVARHYHYRTNKDDMFSMSLEFLHMVENKLFGSR